MRSFSVAVAALLFTPNALFAQAPAKLTADEIVVTAQRSGIPVWRVRKGAATLVLVGTIEGVAKGTNWNPDSLAAALRGADQVMFPQGKQLRAGFFQILAAPGKVRKMERLPAGQSLAAYLSAGQMSELASFGASGILKRDYATRRPLFVAYDLIEAANGEGSSGGFLTISRVDWRADPEAFVRDAIKRYDLRLVPMKSERLNTALARLASLPPSSQVPCLLAAMNFARAPRGSFQARSQAWAARRVPEVINSAAERAFITCAASVRPEIDDDVRPALRGALNQPLTTVAVLQISSLAASGGLLDYFSEQGLEISGPRWK